MDGEETISEPYYNPTNNNSNSSNNSEGNKLTLQILLAVIIALLLVMTVVVAYGFSNLDSSSTSISARVENRGGSGTPTSSTGAGTSKVAGTPNNVATKTQKSPDLILIPRTVRDDYYYENYDYLTYNRRTFADERRYYDDNYRYDDYHYDNLYDRDYRYNSYGYKDYYDGYARRESDYGYFGGKRPTDRYKVTVKNQYNYGDYYTVKFYFEDSRGRERVKTVRHYLRPKETRDFTYLDVRADRYKNYRWTYQVVAPKSTNGYYSDRTVTSYYLR